MKKASVPDFSPFLVKVAKRPLHLFSFLPMRESLCPYFLFLHGYRSFWIGGILMNTVELHSSRIDCISINNHMSGKSVEDTSIGF